MKQFVISAQYTIDVRMVINAENLDEAMEIAERCDDSLCTEWNGNSVFVQCMEDEVEDMTVSAGGYLRDFECEDEDGIEVED